MNEFKEIETCLECSAKKLIFVSEVFYYALKVRHRTHDRVVICLLPTSLYAPRAMPHQCPCARSTARMVHGVVKLIC